MAAGAAEPALRAAVLADPLSDGPRLRYADGVEPDDPDRAALVRVQVQIARWPGPPGDGLWALHDRESVLLDRGYARWTATVAGRVATCRLQRGFVEHVAVDGPAFLRDAPAVFAVEPVLEARIRHPHAVMRELVAAPWLGRLRALDLVKTDVTDDDVRLLAASPHAAGLVWLDLSANALSRVALDAVAASPHLQGLRWLGFQGNRTPDPSPVVAEENGLVHFVEQPPLGRELIARHGARRWLTDGHVGVPAAARL